MEGLTEKEQLKKDNNNNNINYNNPVHFIEK